MVGRRTGCRASLVPKKTQLLLIDKSPDKKDRLAWKWRNGAATAFTDFGDPRTSGDYALCVYDASSGPASLLMRATAPAGGRCGTKPCWKARKGKSFVYADPGRTPDGLFGVQLKSGADGKAAITVGGSGDALPLPTLPLGLPITVQVQAGQGPCWEATYTTAERRRTPRRRSTAERAPARRPALRAPLRAGHRYYPFDRMIAAQARALACSPRMGCSTSSTSSCSAPDR